MKRGLILEKKGTIWEHVFFIAVVSLIATFFAQISTFSIHTPTLKNSLFVLFVSSYVTILVHFAFSCILGNCRFILCLGALFFVCSAFTKSSIAAILAVDFISELIIFRNKTIRSCHFFKGVPLAFFLISVLAGSLIIFNVPILNVSWDEAIHYRRALSFSQGLYAVEDINDRALDTIILNAVPWTPLSIGTDSRILSDAQALLPTRIGYLGYAMGMWFSRLFQLPFFISYRCAKLGNLIFYSFIYSLAIKKVGSGKLLLFSIGLLPISVFLASCFSYDSWTLAFISLGFATFFSVCQKREILKREDWALMVGSIAIGVLPKMGYSVLFCILLLLPKECFASTKQKKIFRISVIGTMMMILSYFLIEYFLFGTLGDERGGVGVDALAQIRFIFTKPCDYFDILIRFLKNYLSPSEYVVSLAYLGSGKFVVLVWISIILSAVFDSQAKNYLSIEKRILGLFILLVFVGFTATSLYIDFTPVASLTINGCQQRYLLPLLFLGCMFTLNGWSDRFMSCQKVYYPIQCLLSAVILFSTIYSNIICVKW